MTIETTSPVPHHVEEAVATIAALHAAHPGGPRAAKGGIESDPRGRAACHVNPDDGRDRKLGGA